MRWIVALLLASCTEANRPQLEVAPARIDLGSMQRGDTVSTRFSIKSTGDAPLRIVAIRSSDPAITVDAYVDVELAPGGTMEALVAFDAIESGAIDEHVTIESTAGELEVSIVGSVIDAPPPGDAGTIDASPPEDGGMISEDGGLLPDATACAPIFDAPAPAGLTEAPPYEESPAIATDGNGTWIAVFISDDSFGDQVGFDPDLFFSRSIDDGVTWSPAAPLSLAHAMSDGDMPDQFPAIQYAAGNWVVVWQVDLANNNDLAAIYVSSSSDGEAFALPTQLAIESEDALPAIIGEGSDWIVAWHAHTLLGGAAGGDGDVAFARSSNGGQTWSEIAALNNHAAIDADWDGEIALEALAPGRFLAVWRSNHQTPTFGPDPDIVFAHSGDGGATWTDARAISPSPSESEMDFDPAVAADRSGNVVAAWRVENAGEDLLVAHSADDGETWSQRIIRGIGAAFDANVSIATDRAGTFVIAWHSHVDIAGSGTEGEILGIISIDGGRTWTEATPLNINAVGDAGDDYAPAIESDGRRWLVVFQTNLPAEMILAARGMCE